MYFCFRRYSYDTRSELKEHKKALVQLIKKHETALKDLREARIVSLYEFIVKNRTRILKFNTSYTPLRTSLFYHSISFFVLSLALLLNLEMESHVTDDAAHVQYQNAIACVNGTEE